MSFDFKLIQEPHKFLARVVLWELLSFLIGQGNSKFWSPFSYFFPMTHGPYGVTKSHDPWAIRRRTTGTNPHDPWTVRWCVGPMTHGLYGAV